MALLILGVLLVLGLVFIGIISRSIRSSSFAQTRSKATDLAEAGIRYAHFQLLHTPEGADWRPALTSLAPTGTDTTNDPDALYLRPPDLDVGLRGVWGLRNQADPQKDLGGPDGLGPFTRINFEGGRALVRSRYAPSDSNIFSTDPQGALRIPGKARMYLILEAVGRPGAINTNDPTTLPKTSLVKFRNYANWTEFRDAFAKMKDADSFHVSSRKMTAFVSIGIIESARYITNTYNVTRDADIGIGDLGVQYEGQNVRPTLQLGYPVAMFDFGNPPVPSAGPVYFGGGIWSNANVRVNGLLTSYLNYTLGDVIAVYGSILGVDANALLTLNRASWSFQANAWQQTTTALGNATNPSLDSRSNDFTTDFGVLRDGEITVDREGYTRSIARKDPPSMLVADPETGQTRYYQGTRESGQLVNEGNAGRFGHGQGVYVNNFADRQLRSGEDQREDTGSQESLFYDWLNPNNNSGSWKGPFYVPRGSFLVLQRDGFSITRDPRGPAQERTWRQPNGTNTNSTTIRYRLGPYDFDGDGLYEISIINTYTPGVNINASNPDFSKGQRFNGLLYFEGNVRVRGIIPSGIIPLGQNPSSSRDGQLTVVSNATVYVEGSITKGVFESDGSFMTRPSQSMLMLMAKDYVALNTTQFFGSGIQDLEEPNEQASNSSFNAVRINEPGGRLGIFAEQLLDPTTGNGANTWTPYARGYREFNDPNTNNGNPLVQQFLVSHTQEDGAAPYSFISMDVNYGLPQPSYLFEQSSNNAASGFFPPNYVTPGYTFPGYIPIYGLGVETWQRYSKFESIAFPMVDQAYSSYAGGTINASGPQGNYKFLTQETSEIAIRTNNVGAPTNSYYYARGALIPHDIRIEASMYAEEGSFFVIPGQWFNPNPNDTRARYDARVLQLVSNGLTQQQAIAQADLERKEEFGSYPDMPFNAEPIDARVVIVGTVSENMPPPIAQQAEWQKKWGWIPRKLAATGRLIPKTHVPPGFDIRDSGTDRYVPNLIFSYDSSLATGRVGGFDDTPGNPLIRTDRYGRAMPPMPRLPVSPTLAFFGEVNP